jgi:predicted phosphodiesterase
MAVFTWLHLSDLHFDSRTSFDGQIIQDAMCEDLTSLIEKKKISIDFVFVTGDIANKGAEDDYKIALSFFGRIHEITGVNRDAMFFVPGNHDVNRLLVSRYLDDKRNRLDNRIDIRQAAEQDIDEYLKRFDNYSKFIAAFYSIPFVMKRENYYFAENRMIANNDIGVIGLNTAWASYGDRNDSNNIYISDTQFLRAIEKVKNANIKIVLLHHPFSWLYDIDKSDCEDIVQKHCDIILHGHLHKQNFHIINSVKGDQITIPAGSIINDRQLSNSYNITQIDLRKKRLLSFQDDILIPTEPFLETSI